MTHTPRLRRGLVLTALLAAAPAGVLPAQVPVIDTVWPAPPETARVRYVGSLTSEADVGRREGFFSRLARRLTGGAPPRYVHLERPFDVLAGDGRIYATNGTLRAVVVLDERAAGGRLLGADVPGGFSRPMGLGGDGTGRVYVADPGTKRVVVFSPEGRFERAFGGPRQLLNPVDVAVDLPGNRVYVVDSHLHQVVVYDTIGDLIGRIGRHTGRLGARGRTAPAAEDSIVAVEHTGQHSGPTGRNEPSDVWENRGSENGEFRYPVSAAVSREGTLYISDQMNFRVQTFSRSGSFLRAFGRLGDVPGTFTRPKGIALDGEGHVYVVDASFNNVQIFDGEGRLLLAFGSLGHAPGQLWLPIGISIDSRNRIVVADRYNNRAQLYQYLGNSRSPALVAGAGSGN